MDPLAAQYANLLAHALRMRNEQKSLDDVILALRAECPSIIQSIKAVRDAFGIPLGQAKVLVEQSSAWQDVKGAFEILHDEAESAFGDKIEQTLDGSSRPRIDLSEASDR